jgi:hypothetical protein
MSIVVTPIPRLIDLAAPAFTFGTANAAGSAATAVASDSTLLAFDTTDPEPVAAAAVVGSSTTAARRSHVHAGFEIGTWTPTLLDASLNAGESQGYENTAGHYLKIGPRVFIGCRIAMTSLGSLTGSEQANIGGLPFTSSSTTHTENGFGFGQADGLAITAGNNVSGQIYGNINHIRLRVWDATTGASAMTVTQVSADGILIFSGQYTT